MKNTIWIRNNHFTPLAMVMMIVLPLATALICLCIGRMNLSVGDVADTLIRAFLHGDRSSQNYSIVDESETSTDPDGGDRRERDLPAPVTRSSPCFPIRSQLDILGVTSGTAWVRSLRLTVKGDPGDTDHCPDLRPCLCLGDDPPRGQ